jgi:hypothetical protein
MTVELAAERGDWEIVHQSHEGLVELWDEYRATYVRLLVQGAHRPATKGGAGGVPVLPRRGEHWPLRHPARLS